MHKSYRVMIESAMCAAENFAQVKIAQIFFYWKVETMLVSLIFTENTLKKPTVRYSLGQ